MHGLDMPHGTRGAVPPDPLDPVGVYGGGKASIFANFGVSFSGLRQIGRLA